MDERHWWIAQQISHAFKIDLSIQTNNTFMERFICDSDVLEKINGFLCMNGSNKIFFCCLKDDLAERNIIALDSLLKIPKQFSHNIDNAIILYFIRHDTNQEINQALIHKEVYCGEIKNVSQILFNIYNDLLLPNFKANRDWGSCSEETKTQIIHNMEKYINTIGTILHDNQSSKNLLLKRVDPEILNDLKQPRLTTDSPVIKICEDVALDWIKTIENILSDICDERFIHPSVGPLSELERWQRKQRLLSNLTEQLKTKECKSIISGLIAVKSKVLKKWKAVDTG
jgi:dynein heavy chain